MAKNNKLLMKLINASGGWENFLYETLRELCKDVTGLYSVDGVNREADLVILVEEVMEIIEAYEEVRLGKISLEESLANLETPPMPKVPVSSVPVALKVPAVQQVARPIAQLAVEQPRKRTAKVAVDHEAGWCQGELPIPAGYEVVNKEKLTVTTMGGMLLGQGNEDGQVKGQDVSGQISNYGKYRLVFKETTIGYGLINFEIQPIKPLPPAPPRSMVPMIHPMMARVQPVAIVAPVIPDATVAREVPVDPHGLLLGEN